MDRKLCKAALVVSSVSGSRRRSFGRTASSARGSPAPAPSQAREEQVRIDRELCKSTVLFSLSAGVRIGELRPRDGQRGLDSISRMCFPSPCRLARIRTASCHACGPDVARRPRAAEIQVRMSDRLGKNTVWIAFKPDHRNPEVQAPLLRRAGHSAREPGRGECDLASVKPRGAEPLPSPGSGGSDRERPQGPPGRRRASLRGKRSAFPARHQARSHLAGAGNLPARTEAAHGQEAEKRCGLWERRSAAGRSSAGTRTGSRKALRAVGVTVPRLMKVARFPPPGPRWIRHGARSFSDAGCTKEK
jgi:hypothetical protein